MTKNYQSDITFKCACPLSTQLLLYNNIKTCYVSDFFFFFTQFTKMTRNDLSDITFKCACSLSILILLYTNVKTCYVSNCEKSCFPRLIKLNK